MPVNFFATSVSSEKERGQIQKVTSVGRKGTNFPFAFKFHLVAHFCLEEMVHGIIPLLVTSLSKEWSLPKYLLTLSQRLARRH